MSELEIKQASLPSSSELYDQGKTSLGDLRELKVGAGSTIFFTDKEGSRWGHHTFDSANAWIKIDGTAQFKNSSGDVLLSTGAIDGNFVNVINTALNTSSKRILSDFTFKEEDYTGAFKAGNPTWDENTGLITGGSGVLINAKGILGANEGTATFTLDATTGDATFAGTLTAATGTLGALTIASGGNIKFGKTSYSDDTNAGLWLGDVSGTAKLNIGSSSSKYLHYDGTDLTILGGTITGATIQTATTGYRVKMTSDNGVLFYNGVTQTGYIKSDSAASVIINSADNIYLNTAGNQMMHVTSNSIDLPAASYITWAGSGRIKPGTGGLKIEGSTGGTWGLRIEGNTFPDSDNEFNCGDSNQRWADGYFEDISVDDLTVNSGCSGCGYRELNLLLPIQKNEFFEARMKVITNEDVSKKINEIKSKNGKEISFEKARITLQKEKKNFYKNLNVTGFALGDVLVWGQNGLEKCKEKNSALVVGVSDKRGIPIVLGAEPIKVWGKVRKGDVLVTSKHEGYAEVDNQETRRGTAIAIAMENSDGDENIIMAMINKF